VELHENLSRPGPPLELHLVQGGAGDESVAWWEFEDGRLARAIAVGKA
jgi:hypothetical protein